MTVVFWIVAIIMAVLAIGFVARPLIKSSSHAGVIGMIAAVPIFAAGFYWFIGSPNATVGVAPSAMSAQHKANTASPASTAVGSVASMVDGLAERLRENPDDGKSWLLLARSYQHLGRTADAVAAYEHAVTLGEYDEKLATAGTSPSSAISSSAQVFGNVQLSERSQDIVEPTDTVFIFARAVGGPPMPVAVLQRSVADLPLDFLLNDTQAMTADFKLSDFEQVIVTARISRSGDATEALQGLEARSDTVVIAENRHLNLTIE
jgi:tetratricopeptide (TPR) repeat protein